MSDKKQIKSVLPKSKIPVRKPTVSTVSKPVRVVVKAQRASSQKMDSMNLDNLFGDITKSLTSSLNRPVVLLSAFLVLALVVTHNSSFSDGFVGKWVSQNKNNSFAQWIGKNENKFIGMAIFLPTVLDTPRNLQLMIAICSVIWIILIPSVGLIQYGIQSFALHTYFRVRYQNTRIFIIICVAFSYYLGWLSLS